MAAVPQPVVSETLLAIEGLKVAYGGIQAVKGIDLEIRNGELVTLIGANGAGKTTTLKAITGLLAPAGGVIRYLGAPLTGKPTYQLLRDGLAMVPEGRGVFARMTIVENLRMGAYVRDDEAQIRSDIERMFVTSRASRSGPTSSPARCRAASSRCSRWRAR